MQGDPRNRDDGAPKLAIDFAADAPKECDGHKDGTQNQGNGNNRSGDFVHRLDCGVARAHALINLVLDRLDHNDGIVHHDADRQHETEHGHHVDENR